MSEAAVISRRSTPESVPESLGRVLVIDDEAEIRESLETLLQLEGYTVTSAATGTEGTTLLGERSFDIVLLDLALPDKNGMDVLTEIHMVNPQQPVLSRSKLYETGMIVPATMSAPVSRPLVLKLTLSPPLPEPVKIYEPLVGPKNFKPSSPLSVPNCCTAEPGVQFVWVPLSF